MSTEVRHGLTPKWSKKAQPIGGGQYRVTIAGHYTVTDKLAACGVESVKWASKRAVKRQGELLAIRSAFIAWFVVQFTKHGGTAWQAREAVRAAVAPAVLARTLLQARRAGKPVER